MKFVRILFKPVAFLIYLGIILGAMAYAQTTGLPGVPAFDWTAVVSAKTGISNSTIISTFAVIVGYVVMLLTSLWKHLGKTTGPTTVIVSAVISALLTGVLGYFTGAFGQSWNGVLVAVYAAVVSFISSNAMYHSGVQKVTAGNKKATEQTVTVVTQVPTPPPDMPPVAPQTPVISGVETP
jgi:hypothetical protein